jgi:hypothetical protein
LRNQLVDIDMQSRLEGCGALNRASKQGSDLSVIRTQGDGNCLLHAAMLSMYGIEDSGVLRCSLEIFVTSRALYTPFLKHFIYAQQRECPHAYDQTEGEYALQFHDVIRTISTDAYLEPIHVFILAHVVRRPIIVYGNKIIRQDSTQQSNMFGIYLPLLLNDQDIASLSSPITLAYDCDSNGKGHFCAVFRTEDTFPDPGLICLESLDDADHVPLPIRFLSADSNIDHDIDNHYALLRRYFNIQVAADGVWHARFDHKHKGYIITNREFWNLYKTSNDTTLLTFLHTLE